MVPETEQTHDKDDAMKLIAEEDRPANVIDAAASGAASGMQLALNVGAMLLAFIALIALLNGILGGIGGWFDYPQLSLELILGWVFSPIAFLIGVPWSEAMTAGSFIGQKIIVNEFVAYMNFGAYLRPDDVVAAEGLAGAVDPHQGDHLLRAVRLRQPLLGGDPGRSGQHGAQPSPRHRAFRSEGRGGGHAVQPDERHHRWFLPGRCKPSRSPRRRDRSRDSAYLATRCLPHPRSFSRFFSEFVNDIALFCDALHI